MNKFSFNNPIFWEKRLLNFSPVPEVKETAKAKSQETTLKFLSALHKLSTIEGGDKPESILKNNPYASRVLSVAKRLEGKTFTLKKQNDDGVVLTVGSKEVTISGLDYVAIHWREVDRELTQIFKGKNISKKLIALGIARNTLPLKKLIVAIAMDPDNIDPKTIEDVRKALDKCRPFLAPGAAKAREGLKGKLERAKAKPVKLPKTLPKKMTNKKFIDQFNNRKDNPRKRLNKLTMNIYREGNQINAQKWDHTSEGGLSKIYNDFKTVDIPVNSTYYRSMFAILYQATDPTINTYLKNKKNIKYFQDPANNISQLEGMADLPTGFSPSAFAKAYRHLQYVQGMLLAQDKDQIKILAKQESLDANSVARKVTDVATTNYRKFADAIKSRDYATAGMYCVLLWGVWRAVKESGWFGKGGKGTKYLAYALAGSAAVIFAKNAGYDVLKMAGFRDKTYEVKRTPLEAIDNILKSNPQYRGLAKDLDYRVVLQTSNVPLKDLEELFQKSNKKGIQFIHPYQFPQIFPKLAGQFPFDMGQGEKPMGGGSGGMSNKKLSSIQREYIRVGQQLYKVALATRAVYNETLKKDDPNYIGKPYEQMLLDPAINPGKVRHLMAAVSDYAPSRSKRKLTSTRSIDEAESHLSELREYGIDLERQIGKSGHFRGKLMGYPVVFVRVGETYRVYLQSGYGGKFKPGVDIIATIPIQDGPKKTLGLKDAVDGVKRRMKELLEPLQGAGGQNFNKPKWINGRWEAVVTLPGAAEFGIRSRKTKAIITVRKDGKGLYIETEGGVAIVLDELVAKEYPVALALIPAVCAQKEYRALKAFAAVSQIQFRDKVAGDKKFTLLVNRIPLQFTYNKTKKKFTLDTADEKKLLKDPAFSGGYVKALEDNPTFGLNKTTEALREAIKAAPQNILSFLWNKITGQTRDPQMKGINLDILSKSIPNYLSHTIIDVSMYESMQRLRRKISGATSLADVHKFTQEQLHDTNARMQGVLNMLMAENMNISSWKREEWMTRVLLPLRSSSSISSRYAEERTLFEHKIYQLMGPMRSDLTKTPHKKAADLMKVYAYYTAHLDNHEYTYTDPSGAKKTGTVRLDALPTPPKAKFSGKVPGHLDPGLRGFYIMNYMKYVQRGVYSKAKTMRSLDHIPDGSATGHWKIMEFEDWVEKQGTHAPLDPLDNMSAFEHKPSVSHAAKKFTKLEKAIKSEFDKAIALLISEYGNNINERAVIAYFYRKPGKGAKPSDFGLFIPYRQGNKRVCTLFAWANSVSHYKTRSQQMAHIQKLIDRQLVRIVFENPDRFFIRKPTLKARLLQRWPWLASPKWVPDFINPFAP